jgi:hypothetical protein
VGNAAINLGPVAAWIEIADIDLRRDDIVLGGSRCRQSEGGSRGRRDQCDSLHVIFSQRGGSFPCALKLQASPAAAMTALAQNIDRSCEDLNMAMAAPAL